MAHQKQFGQYFTQWKNYESCYYNGCLAMTPILYWAYCEWKDEQKREKQRHKTKF